MLRLPALLVALCAYGLLVGCGPQVTNDGSKEKAAVLSMRTSGPNTLDPVQGSTQYDNRSCNLVYQTLLQYEYLKRPLELKPLLLTEMPTVSEDRKTYRFKLRQDVFFHDDPCFPGGKGRKLVASDVFYSFKRMADESNLPEGWWLYKDTIVGFDEYRDQQNELVKKAKKIAKDNNTESKVKFDYDVPVAGMKVINDHEFEILLKEPVYRFSYVLAMFQSGIVPREAVEHYGKKFSRHPIGTGAFRFHHWDSGSQIVYVRNPNYWEEYYPEDPGLNADGSEPYEGYSENKKLGFYEDAGKRLPLLDRVALKFFVQSQPKWLKFCNNEIDYTIVPAEHFNEAYIKRTAKIRRDFTEKGIRSHAEPLIDMVYMGFNMEDDVFGGYTDKKKWLRQAIALSIDWDEWNEAFYNSINTVYDGPIPAQLEGHPKNHFVPGIPRGPDLPRARKLLEKAGHPGGKGLPKLVLYISHGDRNAEVCAMTERNMARIGIRLDVRLSDFSALDDALKNRRAPFFSLAWGSDYPDSENFLQLFYGPNRSPSSNNFNYDRPEYNALYKQVRAMPPSDERTAIYIKMRDMIIDDAPMIGSMSRIRFYLIHDRLRNFRPTEDFFNWPKYLNVKQ